MIQKAMIMEHFVYPKPFLTLRGSPLAWRICLLLLTILCHALTNVSFVIFAVCYILMTIIAPEEVLQMKGDHLDFKVEWQ